MKRSVRMTLPHGQGNLEEITIQKDFFQPRSVNNARFLFVFLNKQLHEGL